MADFDRYIPTLLKWEGEWSDNPKDKGGATMKGVTLTTFRRFFGEKRTKEDLRNITDEQWRIVMKSYWDMCRADEIHNQSIAEIFVDWVVNAGVYAVRFFQRSQGLKADGIVGRVTLTVLNSPNEEVIFNRIQFNRESYYRKLVLTTPSQNVFLNGWLRRTRSFKFSAE